jgi:acyl dehydratase
MTVQLPAVRPRFEWDNISVGDDLGRVAGSVRPSDVQAHAFAIGEPVGSFVDGLSDVDLVPPTLFINDLLKLFRNGYDCTPPMVGGLHTRALVDILQPVAVGEDVTILGSHIAKYHRRGRRYRTCLSTVTTAEGREAVRMVATETVGFTVDDEPDRGDVPENWAAHLPRITDEIPEGARELAEGDTPRAGDVITSAPRGISYEQCVMFSGFPFAWAQDGPKFVSRGIHTDPEIAAAAGYPVPVAQGLMSASHMISPIVARLGARSLHGSSFSFSFIAPVLVGATLTTAAVIDAVDDETVALHAFAKDQTGKIVTVVHARIAR